VPRQVDREVAADNAAGLPAAEPAASDEQGETGPDELAQHGAGPDETGRHEDGPDEHGQDRPDALLGTLSPAPTVADDQDLEMPVFHRIWSSPEPPAPSEPGSGEG
jgi:hypothetical protein